MARNYKRLSYKDRQSIQEMCLQGVKPDDIAVKVGVHRATIYRELERGGADRKNHQNYSADLAQKAIYA